MGLFDTATRTSTRSPTRTRRRRDTTIAPAPTRTSTRKPTRPSPVQPRATDFALRHPDAQFSFDPNPQTGGGTGTGSGTGSGTGTGGGGGGTGEGGGGSGQFDRTRLDQLRDERLAAALEAIGADFDMQEGGLNKQLAALKTLFDRSMLENTRSEGYAREAIDDDSINRGLFRSGIRAQNLVRGLTPFQEQRADLIGQLNPEEGNEGTAVRDIMSMIELLIPAEQRARAGAERDAEFEELDIEKLMALLQAGLGGLG